MLVVRVGRLDRPATTYFVDERSDHVPLQLGFAYLDTVGRIGHRLVLRDYREVEGLWLPFAQEVEFANPLIGTIHFRFDEHELGADLPAGFFTLADDGPDEREG